MKTSRAGQRRPFAVYVEYAGEDTSRGRNYLLGNTALSWGIHFPNLFRRCDLTVEMTERVVRQQHLRVRPDQLRPGGGQLVWRRA